MLERILHPLSEQEFFERYYRQRAVHVPGPSGRHAQLFSWARLNTLLNLSDGLPTSMRLVRRGETVAARRPREVSAAIRAGATLVIDELDALDAQVAAYAAALASRLGDRIKIHAFFSQPESPGFGPHYDTHDIFVLQLEGRKRWRVYEPTMDRALRRVRPAADQPPEQPYLDVCLESGDTLYVPRGHWHDPIAAGTQSLHMCTGVHPTTGVDFVEWLVQECATDAAFRGALSADRPDALPGGLTTGDEFSRKVDQVKTRLTEKLADPSLADRFAAHCRAELRDRAPYHFPLDDAAPTVRADREFTWRPTNLPHVTPDPGGTTIQVSVSGRSLRLPAAASPLLEFMVSRPGFRTADAAAACPGLSALALTVVLAALTSEGLIGDRGTSAPT